MELWWNEKINRIFNRELTRWKHTSC
jgi:hypothetical protein